MSDKVNDGMRVSAVGPLGQMEVARQDALDEAAVDQCDGNRPVVGRLPAILRICCPCIVRADEGAGAGGLIAASGPPFPTAMEGTVDSGGSRLSHRL
jgi:hypothetical protein